MHEIAILGATGYTGVELIRLLSRHPGVKLSYLSSESHAGQPLSAVHPQFYGRVDRELVALQADDLPEAVNIVFCALPHGSSAGVVPAILHGGKRVIDLSADFRLKDASLYDHWYGLTHPAPALLAGAVYGLPELYRDRVAGAQLVANPGCYPTSVLLGLAPLAAEGLVEWRSVVVDSKSGVSGAGRTPRQGFHFPECTENFKAYRVAGHQHTPEIEQELAQLAGEAVTITFTPHLLPMSRGILSTIYLNLNDSVSLARLYELYRHFYRESPFIRIPDPPFLPETRLVRGTNYCDMALRLDSRTGRLIVIAAIDNLTRGASGQAVQNMNLMLGFPEDTGLDDLAGV